MKNECNDTQSLEMYCKNRDDIISTVASNRLKNDPTRFYTLSAITSWPYINARLNLQHERPPMTNIIRYITIVFLVKNTIIM